MLLLIILLIATFFSVSTDPCMGMVGVCAFFYALPTVGTVVVYWGASSDEEKKDTLAFLVVAWFAFALTAFLGWIH